MNPEEIQQPNVFHRILHPEEGWGPLLLVGFLSLVTVHTVEDAKWVREMPSLSGMALLALLAAYLLSRIHVPAILLHPLGALFGFLVIVWQAANAATGSNFDERLNDALERLNAFVLVVQTGQISVDGLPFAVQVLFFTWIVGYTSAWFLYRSHNVWLALIPPGVALLVNLTYLPNRFNGHFLIWVLTALLLIMIMHTVELRRHWRREGVPAEEMSGITATAPMLAVAGGLIAITFWTPAADQSLPITVFWENVTAPWRSVEREFDRLFASVSSGRVAPLHTFGRSMPFRGAVNFGDNLPRVLGPARDMVMFVQAEDPGYWRAESYDSYTGQGWVTTERITKGFPQETVSGAVEEFKDRRSYTHTIEMNIPSDVLFVRGLPIYGTVLSSGEVSRPARYTLYSAPARNRALPSDLQNTARDLFQALRDRPLPDPNEVQRRLPPDLRMPPRGARLQGTQLESVEVSRTEAFPSDYSSVRPLSTLPRGYKYTVTSSVSTASVEKLQEAGTNYPGWVRDQYLQLPDRLPQRVKALAREWTQDSKNPYDMAWALETHLRDIKYNTNIPAPPRDTDGVDHFLFSLQRGYADYYASAMAVLLRIQGIPARVSVGYVPGEWDTDKEHYIVRETHAHAWTEVFFPGFGWIEFNPSPNWPTVPRSFNSSGSSGEDDDPFGRGDDLDMLDDEDDLGMAGSFDLGPDSTAVPTWLFTLIGVVAAGGAAAGSLRLLWMRGLRRLAFPAQAYEKMCRLALFARIAPRRQQTPWEYARVLSSRVPEAEPGIRTITGGYTRSTYGRQSLAMEDRTGIERAYREVRRRLLLRLFKR